MIFKEQNTCFKIDWINTSEWACDIDFVSKSNGNILI